MSVFNKLTADQVSSFYGLIKFLRRLRIIGTFYAKTVQANHEIDVLGYYDIIDMTDAVYGVEKQGYDPTKGMMDAEEMLEKLFGRRGKQLRGSP